MEQLEDAYVDKQLRNAYNKGHRQLIDGLELQLREFVASSNEQLFFEALDSFQRKVLHRLCERYHLEKEVSQLKDDRATMTLSKSQQTPRMYSKGQSRPIKRVVEILEARKEQECTDSKTEAPKPKKVMVRSKNAQENDKVAPIQKNSEPPKMVQQPILPEPEAPQISIETSSVKAVFENHYEYDPDYDRGGYPGQQFLPMYPPMLLQYGQYGQFPGEMRQWTIPPALQQQPKKQLPEKARITEQGQKQKRKQQQYRRREDPLPQATEPPAPKFALKESDFPSL